jgi:hypothetical protein
VVVERTLDLLAIGIRLDGEDVAHMYALDHEHAVLDLDLAGRLTDQSSLACRDLTRFQRASEGAGQSAPRGGDDVVERRRALGLPRCLNAVVLGDRVVDAEPHRLRFGGKCGSSQ